MTLHSSHFHELFRTPDGAVYQCNTQNCYWLDFGGQMTALRVGDFLTFKKQVDAIDLQAMIDDPSPGSDLEILMPHWSSRCFILDVTGVMRLRDLLDGARFSIELNSLVRSCMLSGAEQTHVDGLASARD